jgi:hypothetical protein
MIGGGLVQLVAYGAPDTYLLATGGGSYPHNIRESIMHWFVGREDGMATRADMSLQAIPSRPGLSFPFSVRKERAAAKIQAAWRSAIADPRFGVCRRRLAREFEDM